MPKSVMSHDEARSKVCAICTNQWGNKAARKVNKLEEEFIQNNILVREGFKKKKSPKLGTLSQVRIPPPPL